MFGFPLAAVAALSVVFYFFLLPLLRYFQDSKGLRKYPGFTPLAGVTDLCYCYLSSQGSRSKDLHEAHKTAPILRIGPNALSFGRIRAVKDIYGHNTKCGKDLNYVILGGSHTHLIDVVDKPDHARKRKLMSAAFAIKNLERWEFKVASVTSRLLKVLDEKCTVALPPSQSTPDGEDLTIDFNQIINLWTIEAINQIALSANLGLIEQGTDEVIAEKMDGTLYKARYRQAQNQISYAQAAFVWAYSAYSWLATLSKISPKWRQIWKDGEPWNDVVYHQVMERMRKYHRGEELDDFFSALMTDKSGNPNNLELGEVVSEIGIIINAGADTTAIALSHIMELLLQHPEHLQRLRAELDEVLDEDDEVAPYDKVKDLPFLRACIDEGLRLIPPTSAGLARRTPPEGAQILGEWIPGDTSVSMTIYSAHRDPEIFPDPEEFRPQRWVDVKDRKRMEPYFIPFSTGARGCIGRNISYLEQIVVVASTVHRYEFALASPSWKLQRHEAFNIIVGEMPLKIWQRELVKSG